MCFLGHEEQWVRVVIHGDDFIVLGSKVQFMWFQELVVFAAFLAGMGAEQDVVEAELGFAVHLTSGGIRRRRRGHSRLAPGALVFSSV